MGDHNAFQREYFETVERPRLAVGETPYIERQLRRVIEIGALAPGQAILEVGAGLGKYTLPLLERGYEVIASDLSPLLLERLARAAPRPVETLACDVAGIDHATDRRFDRAVGFFVLHHLSGLEAPFEALAKVVRPGGRVVFCEPVGWNPLYYLQVLLTPGMSFAGEPGLIRMRPGVVLPALARAGFVEARSLRFGYFPPQLTNRPAGRRLEDWLEARPIPFPHAFQLFTARLPA